MKKVALIIAALATVAIAAEAAEDVTEPVQRIAEELNSTRTISDNILERIHFKGDLRLRYESKEAYYDDGSESTTYHTRYRLRLGAKIDLVENFQFEVGMRSGFANPTSGNQTFLDDKPLSDYFFQSLRFYILGFKYKTENTTLRVGRQPYMIYRPIRSQLVWDNDVSFNGVNYQYQDDTKIITLGANQPTLEEKATDLADDVNLFVAQYVHKTKLEDAKLNLGAGFYYYDGLKGNIPLFGDRKGNTLDENGLYANDYHVFEGFGELQFKDVFGKPFKIAASVAYNTAADNNNFGYDLAFKIGKTKNIGDWQLKYSYTDLQEDVTYGAYSDSDNFGGGTAAKGHAIRTQYKFGKQTYLAGTFFFNTLYAGKKDGKPEADYERVQLDAIIKF